MINNKTIGRKLKELRNSRGLRLRLMKATMLLPSNLMDMIV